MPSAASDEQPVAMLVGRARSEGLQLTGEGGCCRIGDYGLYWFKGQSMGTGQANVKAYNRQLYALVEQGQGQALLDRLPRAAAGPGPRRLPALDARDDGWTKVVRHPDGSI
ncbi:hypothetical protein [Streptomyces sp900116325]|uniref:hypothetical protein n=1 Tax=Streptomyces sp. 900116325 TaxID=3154295 RepID=UPI0033B53229